MKDVLSAACCLLLEFKVMMPAVTTASWVVSKSAREFSRNKSYVYRVLLYKTASL